MSHQMQEAGYVKIKQVSVQIETEMQPCGDGLYTEVAVFGIVWIETVDGIFEVTPLIGETEEALATHYRNRGWTDSRCTFFK